MPSAAAFLAGFGLTQGQIFAGYRLDSATATEEVVTRYRHYRFEITLLFRPMSAVANFNSLYYALFPLISAQHDIMAIRNYYHCTIEPMRHGDLLQDAAGTVTFHLIGHGVR